LTAYGLHSGRSGELRLTNSQNLPLSGIVARLFEIARSDARRLPEHLLSFGGGMMEGLGHLERVGNLRWEVDHQVNLSDWDRFAEDADRLGFAAAIDNLLGEECDTIYAQLRSSVSSQNDRECWWALEVGLCITLPPCLAKFLTIDWGRFIFGGCFKNPPQRPGSCTCQPVAIAIDKLMMILAGILVGGYVVYMSPAAMNLLRAILSGLKPAPIGLGIGTINFGARSRVTAPRILT
jgi:hypothetical protein